MKINKHTEETYSPFYIYVLIIEAKGYIDTIREMKNLDDSHDLSLASEYLESFLCSLEKQRVDKIWILNSKFQEFN